MEKKYDFLIVGTGLFGAVSAYLLKKKGYSILLIDKRDHIGGNVYTKQVNGINVHQYGGTVSWSSIATPILLWPTIRASSTTYLSI